MTTKQVAAAERTLSVGTWTITAGAILFSVLTVTPLVQRVSPAGWGWTAPVLPIVVDSAVVIVIRLDSTVARLGGDAGRWPAILRWLTGLMTLALNVGDSALRSDLVGVGVHVVAPALLIATGEAGLAYRRAITRALDRIEREHREQADREQANRDARERQQREDREAREQRERTEREQQREAEERREREAREHATRLEQSRADREAAERREEREHTARLEQERAEREARERREAREFEQQEAERQRAERERRDAQERADREQADQDARERQQRLDRERREAKERAEREHAQRGRAAAREQQPKAAPVNTPDDDKMSEKDAIEAIRLNADQSIRRLVELTGWSIGWVTARRRELSPQTVAA